MPLSYIVTGCSNGIGAQTARLLKSQGHHVVGLDITKTTDNVDLFIPLDLSDPQSIDQAASQVPSGQSGLANIAGLPPREGLTELILKVNYHGQRQFTAAVLDKLDEGASIVNLSSRAGREWMQNMDQVKRLTQAEDISAFIGQEAIDPTRAYNLSKEAMILWTLAESEGMTQRGLRMNSVSPAAVSTRILDDFKTAFGEQVAKNVARAGRPGTPEEIADIVTFMLSKQSNWLRGVDIWVDGGMGAFNMSDAFELEDLKCL